MAKTRGDGDQQEPTLELPSLFGGGKKRRRRQPEEPVAEQPAEPAAEPVEATTVPAPPVEQPPAPAKAPKAPKPTRAARTAPVLPTPAAAIVTGLAVGLAGTAFTYVSLRGCEMLKGTDSCGAAGLGLLVVIIVLMVLGGALLLKLFGVSEPRGTSFLAIGLMCVIVLVTLMEDLFSVWMFLAIPLICAGTYALAHWVTTQFVDAADDQPNVDVR